MNRGRGVGGSERIAPGLVLVAMLVGACGAAAQVVELPGRDRVVDLQLEPVYTVVRVGRLPAALR